MRIGMGGGRGDGRRKKFIERSTNGKGDGW